MTIAKKKNSRNAQQQEQNRKIAEMHNNKSKTEK